MDYLIYSMLLGFTFLLLLLSYDIACQWSCNFEKCVNENVPPNIRINLASVSICYAIPKKHYRIHSANHSRWSLSYLDYVGRTYGEGIESQWAHMNPISLSAREMSPAQRRDVLNDHWGAWIWQKIINFSTSAALHSDHFEAYL